MKKMKKTVLIFAAALITSAAQATILRVSNVSNSGAPYTTIGDALIAAAEGDTIMLDGSKTTYSINTGSTIDKKVVLMGPGYWRTENGIIQEGANPATIGNIKFKANGCTIIGIVINGNVDIMASHVTIARCRITGDISHYNSVSNTIIHQCFLQGDISGSTNNSYNSGMQITNNIFKGSNSNTVQYFTDSYIAYNTFTGSMVTNGALRGCTVEKNVMEAHTGEIGNNTFTDNTETGVTVEDTSTDLAIKNFSEEYASQHDTSLFSRGAFNGDDPYVISGLPSGPVVEDITVPASVAMGSKLNVTIKLGVTK